MSVTINGDKLTIGKRQVVNNQNIEKIMFNGTEVWKYDAEPHPVPDLSSCLSLYSYDYDGWTEGGSEGTYGFYDPYPEVTYRSVHVGYTAKLYWTGGWAKCEAKYWGTINKLALPNGSEIKTLIVYRHGLGAQVIDVSNVNSVIVYDQNSGKNDGHPSSTVLIATVNANCTAGIDGIEYKYV